MTQEKLKIAFPSQGWLQILSLRQLILSSFDTARMQSRAHEIETYHGRAAEAAVRKWLEGFLPKRFGVARGYIVSPGLASDVKLPHFDVIIYDQMESPVLWIEETGDDSTQGRSLAIPVEYVLAVLEVKSSMTSRTVREAVEHLGDILPLMGGPDHPSEPYKLHLPLGFVCGIVCVELRQADENSAAALEAFLEGRNLRGFFGGIVLRAASKPGTSASGRVGLAKSRDKIDGTLGSHGGTLLGFAMCDSVEVSDEWNLTATIGWHESEFARFAFDLVALIEGRFDPGRLSSFYGMGAADFVRLGAKKGRDGEDAAN